MQTSLVIVPMRIGVNGAIAQNHAETLELKQGTGVSNGTRAMEARNVPNQICQSKLPATESAAVSSFHSMRKIFVIATFLSI